MSLALTRVVHAALEEALTSTEAGLLGGVKTWDEYQRLVGKRQGIQQAIVILEDEAQRMQNQD